MSFEFKDNYDSTDGFAANAPVFERSAFITRTYFHLFLAIAAFIGIEALLLQYNVAEPLIRMIVAMEKPWLIVLGLIAGYLGVSWVATLWANNSKSKAMQYLGLFLYVLIDAALFLPLLYIAERFFPGVIPLAAISTGALFTLLTIIVLITRKDFSFLGPFLMFGLLAAIGVAIVGLLFGFTYGPMFTYGMIALACLCILYDTSNVLHHYRTDQYVGAALALFASVALLFMNILQLFMELDRG